MDFIKTELRKLGLSEKEIDVYLAVLSAGSASVRSVSSISNINRGTTYNILKKLSDTGLVSYLEQGGIKRFVAKDPNNLYGVLDSKQDEINSLRIGLGNIVHQLGSVYHAHGNKPLARFYEGIDGAEVILRDVLSVMKLSDNKEYFIYSHPSIKNDLYEKFKDFTKQRVKLGISVKSISFQKEGSLHGLDERKWFKTEEEQLTYIIIYGGRVAFIARDSTNQLSGVVIENDHIYKTQKAIFLNLWSTLPKTNSLKEKI